METTSPPHKPMASDSQARKPWEEPRIVLERSLEARAQGIPMDGRPPFRDGFLGPLGASGNPGGCL